jgi:hypothetical protein
MNNLFTKQKILFKKAYEKVQIDQVIIDIIRNSLPNLPEDMLGNISCFTNTDLPEPKIDLCSKNNTLVAVLKMNSLSLEQEIQKACIDKNLITAHQSIKLSIYCR